MWSRIFLVAALLSTLFPVTQSSAATAIVRDGGTLQLGNVTFRLDGIDTPAFDQLCIDEHADVWTCGAEPRDQLTKLIGNRQVRCDDLGADPTYKKRRVGVCRIEGETTSLSQMIVRSGFGLNVEASASGRFQADEARAREDRQGLWKGCFVAPQEFRRWKKDGTLLGGACRSDRDREIREALFPEDLVMPAGFDRVQATYLYASLVAPAAVVRALPYRLGRRRDTQHALDALAGQLDPAPAVDVTVRRVLRAESSLSRRLRLPFGTSILGVYQAA